MPGGRTGGGVAMGARPLADMGWLRRLDCCVWGRFSTLARPCTGLTTGKGTWLPFGQVCPQPQAGCTCAVAGTAAASRKAKASFNSHIVKTFHGLFSVH